MSFTPEVCEEIGIYVYRLVDPRNGETFYVGKGRGNRVFQHASGEIDAQKEDEDFYDLKLKRIREIKDSGLEVIHIIHRHKIENEKTAYEIEAALIDAYPGLTNSQNGHNSGDYGCRHAEQIIAEYQTEEFNPEENLILINIRNCYNKGEKDVYDCVRGVWVINRANVKQYKLVLAHADGIVRGAYRPKEWLEATQAHFPWLPANIKNRIGFIGVKADCWNKYVGKRVPQKYRQQGAANPVRYVNYNNPSQ